MCSSIHILNTCLYVNYMYIYNLSFQDFKTRVIRNRLSEKIIYQFHTFVRPSVRQFKSTKKIIILSMAEWIINNDSCVFTISQYQWYMFMISM